MNRDQFLQRVQPASTSAAHESDETVPDSRQNHRQQAQRSEDRLNEDLVELARLYGPSDIVNIGAQ